jgi:soluble lytic murein transglycosylase-like protein
MELNEPLIRTGHPPHTGTYKENRLPFFRILRKVALFVVIFILSFHLPNFIPGPNQREQTIREILEVLEKQPTDLASVTKEELAEVIYEEAMRYNHDPKFILALIAIESSFQNWSVSEQGAKGLMQIMPYVAESLAQELGIEWSGDRTLFNPYLNIRIGSYYLSQLIKEFNDPRLALAAYNYGPTYIKGLKERNKKIPTRYFYRIHTVYQTL